MKKLLLFDLDDTLLTSDKRITQRTLLALQKCRDTGYLIGICTSRSRQNCEIYAELVKPDIFITSAGALIQKNGEIIYSGAISSERTAEMIKAVREICGEDVEIAVDTQDAHYWNYAVDPAKRNQGWGNSIYSDFIDFHQDALKFTAEIFDDSKAKELSKRFPDMDCIKFTDGMWYKFTKNGVTKESSIKRACDYLGIDMKDVYAFGDDIPDLKMLEAAGTGIAMGNALDEVKAVADVVIGTNDEDGIADYLTALISD